MGLSRNIILSMAFHCLCVVAVAAIVGRGAGVRVPSPTIPVLLISEAGPPGEVKAAAPAPVRSAVTKVVQKMEPSRRVTKSAPPASAAEASHPLPEHPKTDEQAAAPSDKAKGISIISGTAAGPSSQSNADRNGTQPVPSGATAIPSGGDGRLNADAKNLIRSSIERAKTYPAGARRRGIEGTATAEFAISGNGRPVNIRIVRSSGSQILDAAALETITRAAPFPVVSGVVEVPIVYRLEK